MPNMNLVWEKIGKDFHGTVVEPAGALIRFRVTVVHVGSSWPGQFGDQANTAPSVAARGLPCTEPLRTRSGRRFDKSSAGVTAAGIYRKRCRLGFHPPGHPDPPIMRIPSH